MYYRLLIALGFAGLSLLGSGQYPPAVVWSKTFGTSYSDHGLYAHERADGSYFVVASAPADGDFAGGTGQGSVLLFGLDSAQNITWKHRIGGAISERLWSAVHTPDDNYILVGSSEGTGGDVYVNYGGLDVWIVKVDPLGSILWQRTYGGSGYEEARHVSITSDGNFLIAGLAGSTDGNIYPADFYDVWAAEFSATGALIWQRCFGGSYAEYASSIEPTSDGGSIIASVTYSDDGDVQNFHGETDMWVIKLDSLGFMTWSRTYGGTDFDEGSHVRELADGNYLLTGSTFSSDVDILVQHGSGDGWAAKLDSIGGIIWSTSMGGSDQDGFDRFIEYPEGILISGNTQSVDGDVSILYGSIDSWLTFLDHDGNLVWDKSLGGSNWEYAPTLVPGFRDLLMIGSSASSDLFVPGNQGWSDVWIAKLSEASGILSGQLYADLDQDSIADSNEPRPVGRLVELVTTGELAITDENGEYLLTVADTGIYSVEAPEITYFSKDPLVRVASILTAGDKDSLLHFRYVPTGPVQDLQVRITPPGLARAGKAMKYQIHCRNVGTIEVQNASMEVSFDAFVDIDSIPVTPATWVGNDVSWNIGTIGVMEEVSFFVHCKLDTMVLYGNIIQNNAVVLPTLNDQNVSDNSVQSIHTVHGPYDPNDIQVDQEFVDILDLGQTTLEYMIRFQNTGNDTAFHVAVENQLPENCEAITFEFLGSSHPATIQFFAFDRKMRFSFPNILLPDSTTNFSESAGFIRYRIAPNTTLALGDSIQNTASIFFDLNPPIVTNTALTIIGEPQSVRENEKGTWFTVSPNPGNGIFQVRSSCSVENASITVTDQLGRTIQQVRMNGSRTLLDLQSCSSGIYQVTVRTNEGVRSEKLVIE